MFVQVDALGPEKPPKHGNSQIWIVSTADENVAGREPMLRPCMDRDVRLCQQPDAGDPPVSPYFSARTSIRVAPHALVASTIACSTTCRLSRELAFHRSIKRCIPDHCTLASLD